MRTRGDFGGLRGCAGNQSAGGCLVCRGTPDHAIQCVQRQALPAVASGLLVRQWAALWRNSHCRGSLPRRWRAWLSALELIGSLCCPRQCQLAPLATFTMERSRAGHTQYQPKCLLHGQSPFAQRGYTRHLQACSIHCWGMLLRTTPHCSGLANSWVSVRVLLQQHWLSLDLYGQSSIDRSLCTVQTTKTRRTFA